MRRESESSSPILLLAAIFAAVLVPCTAAAEAFADKMTELLPAAQTGWEAKGPRVQTVEVDRETEADIAYQLYEGPRKKKVLVRLVAETPRMYREAIEEPSSYSLERAKVGGRDAAVRESARGGTLIVMAGARLAEVQWNSAANRDEAADFAESLDLNALEQLE